MFCAQTSILLSLFSEMLVVSGSGSEFAITPHHSNGKNVTVGERTVAIKIIARCSITQAPTGQSKVWWWHGKWSWFISSEFEFTLNWKASWFMNYQRRCGRMCKITEHWLNTAAFGHMEHYNISNVAPTESHKMSERNIFLLQPFEHQQICKPT